jgi:hypothetical protein
VNKKKSMATPTDIDRHAPVIAHHEINIDAPLDTVWHLHIDVASWTSWQEAITDAHIQGTFEPATRSTGPAIASMSPRKSTK